MTQTEREASQLQPEAAGGTLEDALSNTSMDAQNAQIGALRRSLSVIVCLYKCSL